MLITKNRYSRGLMCRMGNEVPGDFCLPLKRERWGMLGKGKRHWFLSSCVFMLFSTVQEEKHSAQVREADVPPSFHQRTLLNVWWWATLWSGYHHNAIGIFLFPKIRQNSLSAQSCQLRSLGLTPGNRHYLDSQGAHRIMKFFKGFWGLFFLFTLFEAC